MPPRILITGPSIAREALQMLEATGAVPVLVPAGASAMEISAVAVQQQVSAMIVRSGDIDAQAIGASDRLRVIAKHGVGVNNIDVDAATARGIPVLITRGANTQSVAEHALAMIFTLLKGVLVLDRDLRQGKWERTAHASTELAGKTIGLVGYGDIGRRLGALVKPFGTQLVVYDPHVKPSHLAPGARLVNNLEELLARADIVSLHCPLTPETRNLISTRELALMKRTAILVNTARGGIINEDALIEALSAGTIGGAGLDSFAQEPPPADSALWSLSNVVVTPHIAGVSAQAFQRMGLQAAQNVLSVLGETQIDPQCLVNPSALAKTA